MEAWAENHLIFRGERRPYRAESVMVEANVRAESVNQCRNGVDSTWALARRGRVMV